MPPRPNSRHATTKHALQAISSRPPVPFARSRRTGRVRGSPGPGPGLAGWATLAMFRVALASIAIQSGTHGPRPEVVLASPSTSPARRNTHDATSPGLSEPSCPTKCECPSENWLFPSPGLRSNGFPLGPGSAHAIVRRHAGLEVRRYTRARTRTGHHAEEGCPLVRPRRVPPPRRARAPRCPRRPAAASTVRPRGPR